MAKTNYLITRTLISGLDTSLNALLDFVKGAVCVSNDNGFITVTNCPQDLRALLWKRLEEIKPNKDVPVNIDGIHNGLCMGDPIRIEDVMKVVTEWADQQD